LNRSFVSALLSLACLSTVPALGQAGSTQADVTLSVGANQTATGVSLTGTVQPPIPGGTLTFFDGSTALNTGGTALTAGAANTSATFAQTFGTSDAIQANPIASWQGVTGDFNEDGTPDLLLLGSGDNLLLWQVFASVPGGKFVVLPFQNFPFRDIAFPGLSVLDVDGDGHLDLLIGNLVVRGKGDGTFFNTAATILPALAGGFIQAYAVDVNGDGKLDIVAVNMPPEPTTNPGTVQFMFTVFRNDGGGTFTSLGTFPLAPSFQTGNLCCPSFGICRIELCRRKWRWQA
jgi:FG-GAP-like repeat